MERDERAELNEGEHGWVTQRSSVFEAESPGRGAAKVVEGYAGTLEHVR
jgi:hypothetical protein